MMCKISFLHMQTTVAFTQGLYYWNWLGIVQQYQENDEYPEETADPCNAKTQWSNYILLYDGQQFYSLFDRKFWNS
jgi:hypothetical protein